MASTSSPRSAANGVLGSQRPRICRIPDHVTSAGDEAIELATRAGLHLDDWQQFVLRQSLGERPDGRWSAQTVGLVVGRQNGKGSVLEARELAGLFLFEEDFILHTAHRQKVASNHFKRLRRLIRAVPEFERRVKRAPEGAGSELIELKDGRLIVFATRTSGNARGLSADLIVYDEAMYLSEQDRSAIVPTLAAQSMTGNPQSWYVGSAVDQLDPSQDGVPFTQVRESAAAEAPEVAFFEWSVPGNDPSHVPETITTDPQMWALANPGLNIRISHEWVEHERTVELAPRSFAVERLGIGDWPDTSGDAGRVIGREAWALIAETDAANRITTAPAFCVDANPDHTWAAIGVAGHREDGLGQFAVVAHERGTGWVVDRAAELQRAHESASFAVDVRGPAASLIDALELAEVRVLRVNTEDYGNACGQFVDDVLARAVRYPAPQPELDEALVSARMATLGDRWKWARRTPTGADISPLVAVTIAWWATRSGGAPTVWDLNEIAAQLRGETVEKPEPTPEPTQGQTFIPLDQAPAHRGLFRP